MIFWHNIFRYPRFFFSSMIGLLLIVLNPLILLIKEKKNPKVFLVLGIILFFILSILILTLQQMLALE